MHAFVDVMLRRISGVTNDIEVTSLLANLAEELDYRSAFMLDFPQDITLPVRLWDSNLERARWWREQTSEGTNSISRSLAALLQGGVQQLEVPVADPRYSYAVTYDFVTATVVPVTFNVETRGVVSLSGEAADLPATALSLQIVCYALLMQVRTIVAPVSLSSVSLTPRERQVIGLSAEGHTSDTVAAELGLSPRTVNQHIDNVAAKLNTRNRVHTVAEALRRNLLS